MCSQLCPYLIFFLSPFSLSLSYKQDAVTQYETGSGPKRTGNNSSTGNNGNSDAAAKDDEVAEEDEEEEEDEEARIEGGNGREHVEDEEGDEEEDEEVEGEKGKRVATSNGDSGEHEPEETDFRENIRAVSKICAQISCKDRCKFGPV